VVIPSVEPSSSVASQVPREGFGPTIVPPVPSAVGNNSQFKALQATVASMAEPLKLLVGKDVQGTSTAISRGKVAVPLIVEEPPLPPQGIVDSIEGVDLAKVFESSGDGKSKAGSFNPCSQVLQSRVEDRWYLRKDGWRPFWNATGKVNSFMVGHSKVPGSFDIEEADIGIR